jgi:hypothetical protein
MGVILCSTSPAKKVLDILTSFTNKEYMILLHLNNKWIKYLLIGKYVEGSRTIYGIILIFVSKTEGTQNDSSV